MSKIRRSFEIEINVCSLMITSSGFGPLPFAKPMPASRKGQGLSIKKLFVQYQ